jgi:hypothetical protein
VTQLRTLNYHPAVILHEDDCEKTGYILDSFDVHGQMFAPRRAKTWDEAGMCRDNFFDSLIDVDRWSKLPLKIREEITNHAKSGRHDMAVHEFQEAEYDVKRAEFLRGSLFGFPIAIIIWFILYHLIFA